MKTLTSASGHRLQGRPQFRAMLMSDEYQQDQQPPAEKAPMMSEEYREKSDSTAKGAGRFATAFVVVYLAIGASFIASIALMDMAVT